MADFYEGYIELPQRKYVSLVVKNKLNKIEHYIARDSYLIHLINQ